MSLRRPVVGVTAACCVALVVAACSSPGSTPATSSHAGTTLPPLSATAYRAALHEVAQEENAAQHQVQQAFHAHTVAQVRTALTSFASDQVRAAQRLAAITPPANAAAANTQLSQAFKDNAGAIRALLAKLRTAKTVKHALAVIQNDHHAQQVGGEIDAALTRLKRLGYTSGS